MMSATTTKEPKRKPVVYIVDDDDGMRRALSVLMTTVGYQSAAFAGPREFIAKHDPSQPSCLVLDVRMPEMSGLELQQHLNGALKRDAENRASTDRLADLKQRSDSLTPREREVMASVVDGKANKVIAIDLGLSERTVEIHRANVMEKMGARSVAHLVKMHLMLGGDA
jgi:two-component system, LuxR family, response regulator FixJ